MMKLSISLYFLSFMWSSAMASTFRKPFVVDKLSFDMKLKLKGEIVTTSATMTLIERPHLIIGLNVTGEDGFGGRSYIGFEQGVIVSIGKNTEHCAIAHISEHVNSKAIWKEFKMQEGLASQGETADPIQGFACRYAGNILRTSWLGRDLERFCLMSSMLSERPLVVDCRSTTEEEEIEHGGKCDIGFIFTEEELQIGCIRLWVPLEDETCS